MLENCPRELRLGPHFNDVVVGLCDDRRVKVVGRIRGRSDQDPGSGLRFQATDEHQRQDQVAHVALLGPAKHHRLTLSSPLGVSLVTA